jgi:hypothetical protein
MKTFAYKVSCVLLAAYPVGNEDVYVIAQRAG